MKARVHHVARRRGGGVAANGARAADARISHARAHRVPPLNAWYTGSDYQTALKIGEKYATFRRFAVEGQN